MQEKYHIREWLELVRKYQKPEFSKSFWQVINSFLPLFALWAIAYFVLQYSVWFMLPITFLASLFAVRIFIIQHDCGHGSFLKNKNLQDHLGFICSLITLTPYYAWKREHALHHAHSGDLDHRDIGEIQTLTVDEYLEKPWLFRLWYRLVRNPVFLFLIAPPIQFIILQRFSKHKALLTDKKYVLSLLETNAGILAIAVCMGTLVGWKEFLLIQGFITYFMACIGIWLFYVQHQFEDGYWDYKPEWNLVQSALHGSSYLKLPKILQWFSGNIGFHHIHHLSPQIPNYELQRCHEENPIFEEEITSITLKNCFKTMKLRFWDEKHKKLVSTKQLRHEYRPRFIYLQAAVQRLKKKQTALAIESSDLKKRFESYVKKNQKVQKCMEHQMMRSQLKTFNKLVKKRAARENIQNYQDQLQKMKTMLAKYFPQFSGGFGKE